MHVFFGNEEVFKELLDRDIAIMVNIDYPTASHVQLIVGYDDRLQVFHVQDPNNRYTHELMYQDLQREFGNNGALSLAISPMGHSNLSGLLPDHVHEMSEKLFTLTEIFHKELSREDQDFLKENIGHMAVSAYIMKYLPGVVDEEILSAAAEVISKHKEQAEYHSLTAAMAYYSAKNNEQAESYLNSTKSRHYPGVYWLTKGRISYGSGQYDEAYSAFKEALKKSLKTTCYGPTCRWQHSAETSRQKRSGFLKLQWILTAWIFSQSSIIASFCLKQTGRRRLEACFTNA